MKGNLGPLCRKRINTEYKHTHKFHLEERLSVALVISINQIKPYLFSVSFLLKNKLALDILAVVTYSYRLVSFSSVLTACAFIFVVSTQLPTSFPFARVVPVGVCYRP